MNVLVMPAFHPASISTKMLQELGGSTVIGPLLGVLNKPVQIVSLSAKDSDIVNMAAIAAYSAGVRGGGMTPTCYSCGEEIEFRYVGGRPTPIHLSGGWCSGFKSEATVHTSPFDSVQSYVNPNALCPVCNKRVFFYQSPNGGRVFFDDLGWPWPKHPCTDNSASQKRSVTILPPSHPQRIFRSKDGEPVDLYELVKLEVQDDVLELEFRNLFKNSKFRGTISKASLRGSGISVADLKNAPSFPVRAYPTYRLIEFISGRRKQIVAFKFERRHV